MSKTGECGEGEMIAACVAGGWQQNTQTRQMCTQQSPAKTHLLALAVVILFGAAASVREGGKRGVSLSRM